MNKPELIAAMSDKTGITKADTEKQLNAFLETVKEELAKGEKIQLVGFGTFEVCERSERVYKHPKTKEEMVTPACKVPRFKAGKVLKEAVKA